MDHTQQRPRKLKKPVGAQAPERPKTWPQKIQILRFIAFLHYNFQKAVGARAPTAPMLARSLLENQI